MEDAVVTLLTPYLCRRITTVCIYKSDSDTTSAAVARDTFGIETSPFLTRRASRNLNAAPLSTSCGGLSTASGRSCDRIPFVSVKTAQKSLCNILEAIMEI